MCDGKKLRFGGDEGRVRSAEISDYSHCGTIRIFAAFLQCGRERLSELPETN